MKTGSVMLTLFLLLASCKKDKLEGNKSFLVGKWNWIYSEHSYGWCENQQWTETLTPVTEEKHYSVEFFEKGRIKLFEDDVLKEEGRIVFDFFEIDAQGECLFLFYLDNDEARGISGSGKDTLRLKYPYIEEIDGCGVYANYFTKE